VHFRVSRPSALSAVLFLDPAVGVVGDWALQWRAYQPPDRGHQQRELITMLVYLPRYVRSRSLAT
jgi:hypothetical protein